MLDAIKMKRNEEHYSGEWNIRINNLKKLINGEGSLRAAFWGVWLLGSVALRLIVILPLAIYAGMSHNSVPFNWFEEHHLIILFPYMLFGYYLILKNSICIKSYWVPIARVFSTIAMLNLTYEIYNGI